ncbi:TrkA C-terminal domain-containing protein [Mycolicibacterium brumae]|uniref:Transporter n=1 Tax=Mycolicibacterium brumae TaxID=85968 RepID=A0A2G5PB73_9MYCO|nr:TrkA C-terminal domain-containing protein [Mycolicibacterium brumae]MCV7193305.1 transporter [Mycolicibacterium brumae]PIB75582.1 transporter [Mycolicibacterium brumae]RWA21050.1 transporter [Mycolicibacterium brumae DSM 44177]UWW09962.1 transporter [Mycolicibacterium brumae]
MRWFVESPLLTLFVCVGVGSLFGRIRFGPVSFGPAGALFVALALAAAEPDVALPPIVTSLSLCVFCYMVGIAAGPSFVNALRTGWKPVLVSLLAIVAMAGAGLAAGRALGLDIPTIAGAFSGAGTATAALGAVQGQLAVDGVPPVEPAIGYAVAYPITVLLTILACAYLISAGRRKPTPEDQQKVEPIVVRTLAIVGDPGLTVHGLDERYQAVVSRLTRAGRTVVAHDAEALADGDLLTVTARADAVQRLIADLGRPVADEPWLDRHEIDFRRITLSNPRYVGRPLHELRMEERFDAVVSRVRRGDVDIIATPDLVLASGDRLRVTAARTALPEITTALGDSERTAGDINGVGLGLGLALGLVLAFAQIPLPGGGVLALGTATAPLVLGLVLGAIGRTGPIIWTLPGNVANTLNQFSLLVFLSAVGLSAGGGLLAALADNGVALVALGLVLAVTHALICVVGLRTVLKFGTARALGGLTGSQLNPAPYAYAYGKVPDQRLALGYAVLFPVSMIAKVFVAQLMVVLL